MNEMDLKKLLSPSADAPSSAAPLAAVGDEEGGDGPVLAPYRQRLRPRPYDLIFVDNKRCYLDREHHHDLKRHGLTDFFLDPAGYISVRDRRLVQVYSVHVLAADFFGALGLMEKRDPKVHDIHHVRGKRDNRFESLQLKLHGEHARITAKNRRRYGRHHEADPGDFHRAHSHGHVYSVDPVAAGIMVTQPLSDRPLNTIGARGHRLPPVRAYRQMGFTLRQSLIDYFFEGFYDEACDEMAALKSRARQAHLAQLRRHQGKQKVDRPAPAQAYLNPSSLKAGVKVARRRPCTPGELTLLMMRAKWGDLDLVVAELERRCPEIVEELELAEADLATILRRPTVAEAWQRWISIGDLPRCRRVERAARPPGRRASARKTAERSTVDSAATFRGKAPAPREPVVLKLPVFVTLVRKRRAGKLVSAMAIKNPRHRPARRRTRCTTTTRAT